MLVRITPTAIVGWAAAAATFRDNAYQMAHDL